MLGALETIAVNCCVPPVFKLALVGEIETDIDGDEVMKTVALAAGIFGLVLCAVTLIGSDGDMAGAVYKPVGVIVPTVGSPPRVPLTSQVTVWLVPDTAAVNCCDCPTCRLHERGETVTVSCP